MALGYSPKDLHFSAEGREKLVSGISKIAKAVASTLGPKGKTVLIESSDHTRGMTVTKDGVTVARSIWLEDPVENLAVRIMKEAADRTATTAGDGTTTAIVLARELIKVGWDLPGSLNHTEVFRHLVSETKVIGSFLRDKAKAVHGDRLYDVARISANNDEELGRIIADVYESVGRDGVVTVENSQTAETYSETTEGIKVDRGYTSPLFINDSKKDECVYDDVHVLVSDIEISNILQIENVLKPIISEGKRLLIIAPCSAQLVNTFAANVVKNNVKLVNINPPDFGYRQHELMQDIALTVGATYFSEKTGDDLSIIQYSDLGRCAKVIVGRNDTIIIKSAGIDETIKERVTQLRDAHALATTKVDRDFIMKRIASLTGGIGVIYVGGNTDLEQKERYDRVDDAVCAVRSALEEGILPGGGVTLHNVALMYEKKTSDDPNRAAAFKMLAEALSAPLYQILENAELEYEEVYAGHSGWMQGYDVKNNRYGYMMRYGIIDPAKVTRTALQNAVSVAVTILSTNAIVTIAR